MGLFEKLGLVEEVPSNDYDEIIEDYNYEEEEVVEAEEATCHGACMLQVGWQPFG